jgi:hypothetical protein
MLVHGAAKPDRRSDAPDSRRRLAGRAVAQLRRVHSRVPAAVAVVAEAAGEPFLPPWSSQAARLCEPHSVSCKCRRDRACAGRQRRGPGDDALPPRTALSHVGGLGHLRRQRAAFAAPRMRPDCFAARRGLRASRDWRTFEQGQFLFEQGGCSVDRRRIAGARLPADLRPRAAGLPVHRGTWPRRCAGRHTGRRRSPMLADPGTYLYHSGGEWRDWFRSTRAHNTLCLGGTDQSRMAGPFNWTSKAEPGWTMSVPGPTWQWVASHDGYLGSHGVRHERSVAATDDGYLLTDRLLGCEAGAMRPRWCSRSAWDSRQREGWLSCCSDADGSAVARLEFESPGELSCRRGGEIGSGGWVSPRFGVREPAWRIVWTGTVPRRAQAVRIRLLPVHPVPNGEDRDENRDGCRASKCRSVLSASVAHRWGRGVSASQGLHALPKRTRPG